MNAFRVVISLVIEARPDVAVDTPIVVTITLSFVGLVLLGTATLRARQLTGRTAWAPLFLLAGGLVAVPFYSFDKVVHFILLGLLWGSAWLHMGPGGSLAGRRNGRRARDGLRVPAVVGHGPRWTRTAGDAAAARDLIAVLPELERVYGPALPPR